MKIRNRHLIRAAGRLGAAAVKALIRTQRLRLHFMGPDVGEGRHSLPDRFIYLMWHESLLLPAARFGGPDLAVLISSHADGQILGGLIKSMGMEMVRGSTTRGGVEAIRQLLRPDVNWKHLAVTCDGPRGPRRIVQQGAVYVASRTGMKIVPIGVGYSRPFRMKSWDRFSVPRPFASARCVVGVPISVPPGLRTPALEEHRMMIQAEMDRGTLAAEQWVETGQLVIPSAAETPRLKLAS